MTLYNLFLVAKALAERYRSIAPEEKERLEGLAKVDKERFVFSSNFTFVQCHFSITRENFVALHFEEVRPARTIWK